MAKISLVVGLILTLVMVPPLNAGCGHFFHHKAVVAVPVAVAVPVYQVGTDLEIKAAVERALREREALASQQAFQAQQNQLKAYQQQQWEAERKPPVQQPTQQYPTSQPRAINTDFRGSDLSGLAPTVMTKCGQCHANANSSAGSSLDLSKGINAEQFFRITDMIANKTNVPPAMNSVINSLKPEEYGKILDEFIKLKKAVTRPTESNTSGY